MRIPRIFKLYIIRESFLPFLPFLPKFYLLRVVDVRNILSKVNVTMNICSTRDTEVMTIESEESEDTEAAAEPRHHDEEDHDHDVFNPREDAEWDFKAGTCVFRLQ